MTGCKHGHQIHDCVECMAGLIADTAVRDAEQLVERIDRAEAELALTGRTVLSDGTVLEMVWS